MKLHTIVISLTLATLPATIGCGPKKNAPAEGETVNPRQAFIDGVEILQKPDRQGNIDYASAYAFFAAAAKAKPGMANAQFNAGWTAEKMGNLLQADEHYRLALEADASMKSALFARADVLSRQDQGVEAVAIFKSYVENNPDDAEVRASYTEALITAEMYEEAIAQTQDALRANPDDLQAYRNLSRMYFAQGNYPMSQLCADKARSLSEEDPGIYNNRGVTFLEMNDEPQAIVEFQRALELDPNHLEANMNLGWVALDSGDYGLAKTCFERATKVEPGNLSVKMGLAVALRGSNDIHGATKLYDEVIAADNKNRMAYFNASTLQEKYAKNYTKALKYLDAYVTKAQQGIADPETQARMDRVQESKAIEDERLAKVEAERKAAEEREARQRQALTDLTGKLSTLESLLEKYGTCPAVIEGPYEMGLMVVEQGRAVIEMEEFEMAGEVLPFLEDSVASIEALAPDCTGAPAAPAPTPEGEGAEGAEGAEGVEGSEGAEGAEGAGEGEGSGEDAAPEGDAATPDEAPAPTE